MNALDAPRFTSGPWQNYEGQVYAGEPRKAKHVATAHYNGDPNVDFKEQVENAKLIAQAPEMFLILQTAFAEHRTKRTPYGALLCGQGCWCWDAERILNKVMEK